MEQRLNTVCELCGGACAIEVVVENDEITRSFGRCPRAMIVRDIVYSPRRLKTPMKKDERGEWKEISWDEAYRLVSGRLAEIKEEHGPESLAINFGHRRKGLVKGYWYRLANLYGTPNMSGNTHICTNPRRISYVYTYGTYGIDPYLDGLGGYPDVENSSCLIVWGSNPFHQEPSEWFFEAKEQGLTVITIDPRLDFLSSVSDEYVPIRPGTDGALALGMLNVIIEEGLHDKDFCERWTQGFDELKDLVRKFPPEVVEQITWVPEAQISRIAKIYAAGSSSIIPGVALEQSTNAVQSCRAIDILIAVTGNYDSPGGNIEPMTRRAPTPRWLTLDNPELDEKRLCASSYPLIGTIGASHTKVLSPEIWDAILTGEPYPIRAMIVANANPAVVFANPPYVRKALSSLDFLVVVDPYKTATTQLADIVLPASTSFEWTWYVSTRFLPELRQKVIEPLWDSRPETEIIFELGRVMGYEDEFPWRDTQEALEWELEGFGGPTYRELAEHTEEELRSLYPQPEFRYRKYEERGFATPSGKVEIYSSIFEKHGYDPLPNFQEPALSPVSTPDVAREYPLILTTGKHTPLYTHSMFKEVEKLSRFMPENFLEINPSTAGKLGVGEGEKVRVVSPTGGVMVRVKLTKGVHPLVVGLRHGFSEANCNNLIDNFARDLISGSTSMKASLCKVERI